MLKQTFRRDKPCVTIGTIGHIDHGKTPLTSVLTGLLAKRGLARASSYDEVAKAPVAEKAYEFCYIDCTNKIKGATAGFTMRPIAIR